MCEEIEFGDYVGKQAQQLIGERIHAAARLAATDRPDDDGAGE